MEQIADDNTTDIIYLQKCWIGSDIRKTCVPTLAPLLNSSVTQPYNMEIIMLTNIELLWRLNEKIKYIEHLTSKHGRHSVLVHLACILSPTPLL